MLGHLFYGIKFEVVTDHIALQWLMNFKDPHGRVAKWQLYLQAFDFTVIYRQRKKHGNADASSPPPLETTAEINLKMAIEN